MDDTTGVDCRRLLHADGVLGHLMDILNIIECCWFNLTRNSHTHLTWPLSEFFVSLTSQRLALNLLHRGCSLNIC